MAFNPIETTIADVHAAYRCGELTCRQLVQTYLDRIEAFDKSGPAINAIISVNPGALAEADRLDAAFKSSGPAGPLHGIPIIVKDQCDAAGMPTTADRPMTHARFPSISMPDRRRISTAAWAVAGRNPS